MDLLYTAIVVTCSDQESANAFQTEIVLRQKKSLIHPDTVILCVVDPKPNIGSGGATLNAIFSITEHISAIKGYTVISADVLQGERVLILHMGTSTPYSACSPGFLPLPAFIENGGGSGYQFSGLATQFDVLLQMTIDVLARDSPPGVWVCSCDRMISIPKETEVDWSLPGSVRLFTVPVHISAAANRHGVAKIGEQEAIEDIIYKGSESVLEQCVIKDSQVPVVSGIVFFETKVADTLLNICVAPPLDNCTYLALDAGFRPTAYRPCVSEKEDMYRDETDTFVLSLFFDVLLCMASHIEREEYITGKRGGVYGTLIYPKLLAVDKQLRQQTRQLLWDSLHGISMKAEMLEQSNFVYVSNDPAIIHNILLNCPYRDSMETSYAKVKFRRRTSSISLMTQDEEKDITTVNTIVDGVTIGDRCVLLHSDIQGGYHIGNNCLIVNIKSTDLQSLPRDFRIPDDIVLESLHLKMDSEVGSSLNRILLIFGIRDRVQQSISQPDCTIFNKSWDDFFKRTTILPTEVWSPDVPPSKRCLLNARLFPVYHPKEKVTILHLLWLQGSYIDRQMSNYWRSSWKLSLSEILNLSNPDAEFAWRRDLYFNIGQKRLERSLRNKLDECFIPFFKSCIMDGYFHQTLKMLDNVAKTSADPAVVSRTFACIADVLGVKSGGIGGLRSGPAANYTWKAGLELIKNGKIIEGVDYMANLREQWLVSPDLLVRAARHYEGAFQILVRKAVATARQFIRLSKGAIVPMKTWVNASCPGRMDLSGGWTDTPPLCYEIGGLVVSIALDIDYQKPIGCRVQRIPEPKIILIPSKDKEVKIECEEFSDLMNFSQPNIPGALLRAAFFCSDLLPLHPLSTSLSEYLLQTYGGGFLLQTWSNLPHGSGLGTSSILAGAVISSLWTVAGMEHDRGSVIHAVLDLEQMLTTGGGWQDQVGGLYPGVKVGSSSQLPLQVQVKQVELPPGFQEKLERHLIVVFTGKTRLARNMLQDVLRNWNARSPEIVETTRQLECGAKESIDALTKGDIEGIGKCLSAYWRQKKMMAHGCEPNAVKTMMDKFEPHVYGQSLAGAGGGGFMYLLTKEENAFDIVSSLLKELEMEDKASVHRASIDNEGLLVTVDTAANEEPY